MNMNGSILQSLPVTMTHLVGHVYKKLLEYTVIISRTVPGTLPATKGIEADRIKIPKNRSEIY